MANTERTVDVAKLEAAFSKLRTNPEMADPVKRAFDEMFAKINMDLSSQEQVALAKYMFGSGSDPQYATAKDEVSYSTCPITVSTCPPSFTADICTHCPSPPSFTADICTHCPSPPPPTNTGHKCAIICF